MSTIPSEATSTNEPLPNIPDYPGADIILGSQDSHHFRVPKIFIIHNSPVLNELVRRTSDSPGDANAEASLPVLQLPENGRILRYLLTFMLPVFPAIPPTHEESMELLSVAQKYQMETVLVHIRGIIARQNPLPTQLELALHIYTLAQKYGLLPEALQTARIILKQWMTIEDFDNTLDTISGASLYELLKYQEKARTILALDLTEFRESGARGTITGSQCTALSSSLIPLWVDQYIESIAETPKLFDTSELNIAMARHTRDNANETSCECALIPSQTIRDFWEALASVVHGSFKKAESALSVVQEREDPQFRINPTTSPLEPSDASDANLVIRSSDLVNFKVHKSVLAAASPFFKDLLSLHQPPDSESVDGLPVVQLPEDSELLSTLVSMLYPLRLVVPNSYDKVLYLLAACQKYEMASVQLSIRAEGIHGVFPTPKGAEAFTAYAIACGKGLIPEMENAARQTLDHPMTFEVLGEGLRLFGGWALRDLTRFRKRCRDNLVACFESILQLEQSPFNVWIPCAQLTRAQPKNNQPPFYYTCSDPDHETTGYSPSWLTELFQKHLDELCEAFSKPLLSPQSIHREYLLALEGHINSYRCISCTKVHALKGVQFCKDLEDRLMHALGENSAIHE